VVTDGQGNITEIHCTYSDEPRGLGASNKKRPAIIHWVPAKASIPIKVRLYDRLFTVAKPTGDLDAELNSNSLIERYQARLEPNLVNLEPGERFQFERLGYFICDADYTAENPLFNRIVTLKDSYVKSQKKQNGA
jgi:glutaminyl-tRNA synthetase